MEKIKVTWDVNVSSGEEEIDLNQLNCETLEDWVGLPKEEQEERLQNALDELPERVCIILDKY